MRKSTLTVVATVIALAMSTLGTASAHEAQLVDDPNLTSHNNGGTYHHDYNVTYTCGTDGVVLLSGTGKADDNAGETILEGSFIDWNDMTFHFISRYTRADNYTYSLSGPITADGSYSGVSGTGGALDAVGRFIGAPSCTVVPVKPADACKDGGWQEFVSAPGPFKNQGQCVSFHARNG